MFSLLFPHSFIHLFFHSYIQVSFSIFHLHVCGFSSCFRSLLCHSTVFHSPHSPFFLLTCSFFLHLFLSLICLFLFSSPFSLPSDADSGDTSHVSCFCGFSLDFNPAVYDLDSRYAQSKWVAEQLVLRAKARGLPVVIYRLGK